MTAARAVYDVEVQLRIAAGNEKRIVLYGCELYADQLREGGDYAAIPPVYTVWLVNGVFWPEGPHFHHAFRLTDAVSGRVLDGTLAIHTIELPKYNTAYPEVAFDDLLGHWLHWLKHRRTYEPEVLLAAFPQPGIRRATEALIRIAQITKDKAMYDARERAIRDRKWEIDSAKQEGKTEGEIKLIRTLQGLLYYPLGDEKEHAAMSLRQLEEH